ncbi:MAG: SOUL-domain-containing protein [Monoraphidium minutum]|nr:MAG: SOUL-domain-containing protein [Monoraphidium minutum]
MLAQQQGAMRAAHRRAAALPATAAPRRQRRGALVAAAAQQQQQSSAAPASSGSGGGLDMKAKMEWLKEDLSHLFDDKGVDPDGYDTRVEFLDPITKYSSVQGYLFNIKFLKLAFTPQFTLHDLRVTGSSEITTRWTMVMRFNPARALGLAKFWDPEITFTGTSRYGFNPANGKINRHIDTWDSIQNQKYFSTEAFGDFLGQVRQRYTTPAGLETPAYTLLRRAADYQVRRYAPFLVAESPLDGVDPSALAAAPAAPPGGGVSPATAGKAAFGELARYLFGGNAEGRAMKMTTPVLSGTDGSMAFVIGPGDAQDLSAAPAPAEGAAVALRSDPGGDFAAAVFSGVATPRACADAERALRDALLRDGLAPAAGWSLARYNDPGVPPARRRNEVLIRLEPGSFDLWR